MVASVSCGSTAHRIENDNSNNHVKSIWCNVLQLLLMSYFRYKHNDFVGR